MQELLEALGSGNESSYAKVAGIAYRATDGSVLQTAPRLQIKDLEAQPWPAREAVDVDRYVRTWREAHGKGSVSFITARGCPYKCRWCSHQVYGQTHRRRSASLVVDEVEWLLNRYQPDMAWVADDVFHHPPRLDSRLCRRDETTRLCTFRSNAFHALIASTPKFWISWPN